MNLAGVFAPLPTPFDDQDRVDTARLAKAIARWVTTPLTGFVVLGSNGEAVMLDDFESDRVVVAAREAVPRGRPLIIGTGRESTQAAIKASKRAAEHGADAVLVRTPGFFKNQMTGEAFIRHYTAVADASPVPVLLYNFTALTGVNLQPAPVAKLALHPNIIGMKESGGDVGVIADLVNGTPKGWNVLAGTTGTFYAALCVGAVGGVLAVACVLPDACVRLFELTKNAKHDEARDLQRRLMPITRLLGNAHGVPGLKAALKIAGYDLGLPRPPLAPVDDAAVAALRSAIDALSNVASPA